MLRAALNIRCADRVSNAVVFQDIPLVTEKIRSQRLRMAGHLARHDDLLGHDLLVWKPAHGRARRGRPLLTFPDVLLQDLDGMCDNSNEMLELMCDRDNWRSFIATRPLRPP